MKPRSFSIRLRSLFVITLAVAIPLSVVSVSLIAPFLASIISVALLVTYFSRFTFHRVPITAGVHGTLAGMGWSGISFASAAMVSTGEIAGLWMFPVGVMIGLLFSLIPVSIIALFPGPKLVYHGERDERTDNTVSSITPYIGGQG